MNIDGHEITKEFFKKYNPDGEFFGRVRVVDSTFLVFFGSSDEQEILRLNLVELIQDELKRVRRNALGLESWQKASFAEAIYDAIQKKSHQLGIDHIKAGELESLFVSLTGTYTNKVARSDL